MALTSGNIPKDSSYDSNVNLDKRNKFELLDLLQIQDNLLKNSDVISRLADRGEKIKRFRDRILHHIKKYEEKEQFVQMFSNLNINDSKDYVDNFEWNKNFNMYININCSEEEHDGNISVTCSNHANSPVKRTEENFKITPEINTEFNVKETKHTGKEHQNYADTKFTHNKSTPIVHEYAKKLCEKFDDKMTDSLNKNRFFTNKPINNEKSIVQNKTERDITAAIPSPGKYTAAKLITLEEAIVLHKEQSEVFRKLYLARLGEKLEENVSAPNFDDDDRNEFNDREYEDNTDTEADEHDEDDD